MTATNKYQKFLDTPIDDLLEELTIDEKVRLLAGETWWTTFAVPRLGIPSIKCSDGPNGVRGASHFKSTPAQAIPTATALGATWNVDTLEKVGNFLAAETLAKGSSLLLAPTINIQRHPLGGRAFESFCEDSHLSGMLASAYVNGLQDKGVGAVIKHFVANDQEHERMAVNSEVDERTLREVYLKPFQIAQKHSKPWSYMTSYGRIDNVHCSENKRLLQDILRKEWGFDGLVMSDWFGTYSVSEAINAGLDLEMPGPSRWRAGLVHHSLLSGKILPRTVDARVKAILELAKKCAEAHPEAMELPDEGTRFDESDKQLNRDFAAEAIVLLKNENQVLPIKTDKIKKIAVIGPNVKARVYSGGGSSALNALYVVIPFQGIMEALPKDVEVLYEVGCHSTKLIPLLDGLITVGPEPTSTNGYTVDFYNGLHGESGLNMIHSTTLESGKVRFNDSIPGGLNINRFSAISTGYFHPDADGSYEFGLTVIGRARLYVNDTLVIDMWVKQRPGGTAFYGQSSHEEFGQIELKAGVPAKVVVEYDTVKPVASKGPVLMPAAFRFGAVKTIDPDQAIKDAATAAAGADAVIMVVGTNMDWETEGNDRDTLILPGRQDELIAAVAKANPKTIVVNQSGSAVTMPWAKDVSAVVQSWFAGCEMGNAIADVIFGKVNPSGKMPMTFPVREQDVPAHGHFASENFNVRYAEGLFVGYKWYDAREIEPLWAFGHGLSYTTFSYSDLEVSTVPSFTEANDAITIEYKVTNIGSVEGAEVSQVYVTDVKSTLTRPVKELKGFTKVLLKPGESKVMSVKLEKDALSYWDDDVDCWRFEAGSFKVFIGTSSRKMELEGAFEVKKGGLWSGV